MIRYLIAGCIYAAVLSGQTLRVPPSHAARETPGAFTIQIDSPPGRTPATIQFELSFPPALAVSVEDIAAGAAAEAAGKRLTCARSAVKTEVPNGVRFACIVAGGQKPIGNGNLAVVRYHLLEDVGGAPIRVPIEHILAVSSDLKAVHVPDVDAIITTG